MFVSDMMLYQFDKANWSTKYHVPEWRQGPAPRGKKELFNYAHSSLRNVIERSFEVLKMK